MFNASGGCLPVLLLNIVVDFEFESDVAKRLLAEELTAK